METQEPYAGDAGDERQPNASFLHAAQKIRKELQENLDYACLYLKLCRKAKNAEGVDQWQEQVDKLVAMLAELDHEERVHRLQEARAV